MQNYAELLFINEVRELQDQDGTGDKYASFYPARTQDAFNENDIAFITSRRSFYIASVSSTGWPYVQHRGGPTGFLKILGPNQIGFADYRGNRQFVTMGHAAQDNRVALFLMDYENRTRLKMLGHLTMQPVDEAEPSLRQLLDTPGQGKVDRIATIDIVAMDWNCPKHIPSLIELERAKHYIDSQLKELRDENERLRQELEHMT